MTSVGPLHTPSLAFRHLPPRRKNVVTQCLESGSSFESSDWQLWQSTHHHILQTHNRVYNQHGSACVASGSDHSRKMACKGFIIRVDLLVSFHGPSMAESLTAHITNKGFMTRVDNLVFLQITSPDKGPVTYITNKGFVTNVDQLVCFQALSVD